MSEASEEVRLAGFRVGELLVGRFRIIAAIGEGGTAEVYRAVDLETERPVALKLMRTSIADDPEALERMRREGEILERLRHPAIVAIVALGAVGDGRLFIAMELLEGETLGARMRRGPLTADELAPVVAGVAAGLTAAHGLGIVHRDLKPENIFLTHAPDGARVVKLLDFGVSKMMDMERLTQTGQVIGTPRYMAPEQLTAERDADGRVDVYALGVILYEALAGRPAFDSKNPSELIVNILHGKVESLAELRPELSAELVAMVSRAMAHDVGDRFGSVAEVADAFIAEVGRTMAPTKAPMKARQGVATSVLGGMDGPPPSPSSDEGLKPGTFSELEAAPPARLPAAVSLQRPTFSTPSDDEPAPLPRREERRPTSSGSMDETLDELPVLPLRGAGWATRVLLVAIALAAGGVTAAAAIAAWRDHQAESSPSEIMAPPEHPEGAALPDEAAPETDALEAPPSSVTPSVPEPTIAPANPEATKQPPSRRRRRQTRREVASMEAAPPVEETPPPPEPADDSPAALLRSARAALRSGDAPRCIELLDQALASGAPSFALRMRGDCLLRSGRQSEALRSYERFCRIAPDHPAISEVRALVDGLGGRCD